MPMITLVLTTFPDTQAADVLIQYALDAKLAACATQLASARSCYFWQGKIERADEIPVLFKTTSPNAYALERLIIEKHPYQIPEVLIWRANASASYAQWMIAETCKKA